MTDLALQKLEESLSAKDEKPEPWVIVMHSQIRKTYKGKYLFASEGAASCSLTASCDYVIGSLPYSLQLHYRAVQELKAKALKSGLIQIMTLREFLALPKVKL